MTTFAARTAAQIRDDLLAYWSSRFSAIGLTLQIAPLSHAWNLASTIGIIQAAIDAQAVALTAQILPDQATGAFLVRHGFVQNVPKELASPAQLQFAGTGSNGSVSLGSATIQSPSGARFIPQVTSVTVSGGTYHVNVTAQTPGSAGNLPFGTICGWSTPPAGLNANVTVATSQPLVAGTDDELDPHYQQRILSVMQERPASGNRADWKAWVEAVLGVGAAYVYPVMDPGTLTTGELGAVTVVALGPQAAPGGTLAAYPTTGTGIYDPTFTRVVSGTVESNCDGYIEGTNDAAGNPVAAGVPNTQLRPVTIEAGSYGVLAAIAAPTNVPCTITVDGAYATTATQYNQVTAAGSITLGVVTLTLADPIADLALVAGVNMILNTVGGNRGGLEVVTIQTTPTQGTHSITVSGLVGDPTTPIADSICFLGPYTANFSQCLEVMLSYFDNLGPGDIPFGTNTASSRWPPFDTEGRGTFYKSELSARFMDSQFGAPGIVDVSIATSGTIGTNVPFLLTPGLFNIHFETES